MEQEAGGELVNIYAGARAKYKPHSISALLIAETPPCALDRFFYFEDVKRQDSLFLEIMGVLYPEHKAQYLQTRRDTQLKADLLERFSLDGYWLIDLYEIPTSIVMPATSFVVDVLLTKLEKLISRKTPIICIKTNVYDACFEPLTAKGFNVIDERIPFPGSGQQGVFRQKFARALEKANA